MGLIFAKFYNDRFDTVKKDERKSINVFYGDETFQLKEGDTLRIPSDDFIEVEYIKLIEQTIKLTYGVEYRIVFSVSDNTLIFTIIKDNDSGIGTTSIKYPLLNTFQAVRIVQLTEEEYKYSRNSVMSRYMEYRD